MHRRADAVQIKNMIENWKHPLLYAGLKGYFFVIPGLTRNPGDFYILSKLHKIISTDIFFWIPAFAGMTTENRIPAGVYPAL